MRLRDISRRGFMKNTVLGAAAGTSGYLPAGKPSISASAKPTSRARREAAKGSAPARHPPLRAESVADPSVSILPSRVRGYGAARL